MWLDRLGANPPPSGFDSRPISPLPRRVSARAGSPYLTSQQRSARVSTASLVSSGDSQSASTTSLLRSSSFRAAANGAGAAAGGSSLRQSHTIDDGSESFAVLGKILGAEAATNGKGSGSSLNGAKGASSTITEEDLDREFDFGGLSLRDFVARGDGAGEEGAGAYRSQTVDECMWASSFPLILSTVLVSPPPPPTNACISSYAQYDMADVSTGDADERDKSKFEDLHRSIRACDDVLTSVETNLTSFRNDLATVSADIESLQARSTALNVRLENRRAVEKGLGPVVEELSVSPHVVSKIAEGHVDEAWIKVLAEVDRRSEAHKKSAKSAQGQSAAAADLGPLLEKLTIKV